MRKSTKGNCWLVGTKTVGIFTFITAVASLPPKATGIESKALTSIVTKDLAGLVPFGEPFKTVGSETRPAPSGNGAVPTDGASEILSVDCVGKMRKEEEG